MDVDDLIWMDNNGSFFDIKNNCTIVKWTENPYKDLIKLSQVYFKYSCKVCDAIFETPDNNKCDTWFFPVVYMFRQSIKLIIKALICKNVKNKYIAQNIFVNHKYNLSLLFSTYKKQHTDLLINDNECIWIEEYLYKIKNVDNNSDLFRYPFTDDFYDLYENKFFDIVDIGNAFLNAYTILMKCDTDIENKEIIKIDVTMPTDFIIFADSRYGNCFIWRLKKMTFMHI